MSKKELTSQQAEAAAEIFSKYSLDQVLRALREFDRGNAYRGDRGKAERLSNKLIRAGHTEIITELQELGLVGWYRKYQRTNR